MTGSPALLCLVLVGFCKYLLNVKDINFHASLVPICESHPRHECRCESPLTPAVMN